MEKQKKQLPKLNNKIGGAASTRIYGIDWNFNENRSTQNRLINLHKCVWHNIVIIVPDTLFMCTLFFKYYVINDERGFMLWYCAHTPEKKRIFVCCLFSNNDKKQKQKFGMWLNQFGLCIQTNTTQWSTHRTRAHIVLSCRVNLN